MARILRGDIRWADLNPTQGYEQAGLRPVVIKLDKAEKEILRNFKAAEFKSVLTPQRNKLSDPLGIMIKRCFSVGERSWLIMRQALWPHCSREQHLSEMERWCADQNRFAIFLAFAESEHSVGFAEASIRNDYVNGTDTSPVGFLEGLYVVPEIRQKGIARELVAAVERWVALAGCQELASDTDVENEVSQEVHKALGFEETERVVFFRRRLSDMDAPKGISSDAEKRRG